MSGFNGVNNPGYIIKTHGSFIGGVTASYVNYLIPSPGNNCRVMLLQSGTNSTSYIMHRKKQNTI
ncbi:MAG: hypothetical protein JXB00_19225 [Bacteroidales bacterium]|nr:hypothetical protein [Bacteroidales bacterium]